MAKTGVFFGSSTGNTEDAAKQIAEALGVEATEISSASDDEIIGCDYIVFGLSTWGAGDLQDDFDDFMDTLESMDFSGKKVAILGLGDQESYPDTFVDGMGIVGRAVKAAGGELVGAVATDGYEYDASEAEEGGKFIGLPLDEDNQSDQSADRIAAWVAELKKSFT